MGAEIAALTGLSGLTSAFALISLILTGWMVWRIVAKAGFPGWLGLLAVLLPLTGVGSLVTLILLWVFAFSRWPRDGDPQFIAHAQAPAGGRSSPGGQALPPPAAPALPDRRGWKLAGTLAGGIPLTLGVDGTSPSWLLTGAP